MSHRFRPRLAFALIVIASLALTACNKTVKRVSEPAASVQELTVRADGMGHQTYFFAAGA